MHSNYGLGRGRGGRFGGRGGGQGRGSGGNRLTFQEQQMRRKEWEQRGLSVATNMFRLLAIDSRTTTYCVLYKVEYEQCVWQLDEQKKRTGKLVVKTRKYPVTYGDEKKTEAKNSGEDDGQESSYKRQKTHLADKSEKSEQDDLLKSSEFSRRVLPQIWKKVNKAGLVCENDGSQLVVTNRRIEHSYIKSIFQDSPLVVYNDDDNSQATYEESGCFTVQVGVDTSDEDLSQYSRKWYFLVRFKEVDVFPIEWNQSGEKLVSSKKEAMFTQIANIILRSSMISSGMVGFGRSPTSFFFPPSVLDKQQRQLGPLLGSLQKRLTDQTVPLFGLSKTAKLSSEGIPYAVCKSIVNWAQNEDIDKRRFPLLDARKGTLVGISVNLGKIVEDEKVRSDIVANLQREVFHVVYDRQVNGKKQRYIRLNLRVCKDLKEKVIWDPEAHRFDFNDRKVTVREYMKQKWGVDLLYPNMPLIRISKKQEYYPAEQLYHGLREHRGDLLDDQKRAVLKFKDEKAGKIGIEDISSILGGTTVLQSFQSLQDKSLSKFNLKLSARPEYFRADVFPQPTLCLGNGFSASITDGSWNLIAQSDPLKFESPAVLSSLAIVDFRKGSLDGRLSAHKLAKSLLACCTDHGMTTSIDMDKFEDFYVSEPDAFNLKMVDEALQLAINKGRTCFLKQGHKTHVRDSVGGYSLCTILGTNENHISVRLDKEEKMVTSADVLCPSIVLVIKPDKDRQMYNMIKFAAFSRSMQTQVLVQGDHLNSGQCLSNIAMKMNAKLSNSHKASSAWRLQQNPATDWLRQSPTLIIGITMASGKDRMMVSGTAHLDVDGLPVGQALRIQKKAAIPSPTAVSEIVVSLALQYSRCNDAKKPKRVIVYVPSADENSYEDLLKKMLPAIKKAFSVINILSENSEECCFCRGQDVCFVCVPLLTLVAVQENNKIIVVPEYAEHGKNVPSGTCIRRGIGCFPQFALSESNDFVVSIKKTQKAVASGVNRKLESHNENMLGTTCPFLLIPHRGLKGTSKPVLYRSLWNENLFFTAASSKSTELSSDILEELTYNLSFQYGTATKATRLPAILQYSDRLANLAVSFLPFLFDPNIPDSFIPELEDEEGIFRRKSGDGTVFKAFDLTMVENEDESLPFQAHFSA